MGELLMEQERYVEPMEYFPELLDINVFNNTSLTSSHSLKPIDKINEYFDLTSPLPAEDFINKGLFEEHWEALNITAGKAQDRKYEIIGEHYFETSFNGINIFKRSENISEKEKLSKSDEELFKELYDSFEVPDIEEFDSRQFIMNCEEIYKMTTEDFIKEFTANGFEGNVDMQLWFHHANLLKNDGETL